MSYQDYLKSKDWELKRIKKLKGRNRCAICGNKKNLDVHHLRYRNLYDTRINDLRVLCRDCHFIWHELIKTRKLKNNLQYNSNNNHTRFLLMQNMVRNFFRKMKKMEFTGRINQEQEELNVAFRSTCK